MSPDSKEILRVVIEEGPILEPERTRRVVVGNAAVDAVRVVRIGV